MKLFKRLPLSDIFSILIAVSVLSLCLPISAFSETIKLKSGQSIEGKIIERTDKYMKVEVAGVVVTYDLDEIEGAQSLAEKPEPPETAIELKDDTRLSEPNTTKADAKISIPHAPFERPYVSYDYGFSFQPPKGWFQKMENSKDGSFTISFTRNEMPDTVVDATPVFGVIMFAKPDSVNSALEMANQVADSWKKSQTNFELVQFVRPFKVNGLDGADFLCVKGFWDKEKKQEIWSMFHSIYLLQDNRFFNITLVEQKDKYETTQKEVEASINSFHVSFLSRNGRTFRNLYPKFDISLPSTVQGWEIFYKNEPTKPMTLLNTKAANPLFIDTNIDFYDKLPAEFQALWSEPKKAFESKAKFDKEFERNVLSDVEFVKEEEMTIAGLPAYDRIYKSLKNRTVYHSMYILFPEGIMTFGLNSDAEDFEKNDQDFKAIMNTLIRLP